MPQHAFILGVMGPAQAEAEDLAAAVRLGRFAAEQGWVLLNGGRNAGVMSASAQAARKAGGLTLGILPGADRRDIAQDVLLPLTSGLGNARNQVNVCSSDLVAACAHASGAGTASEIALAVKARKPVFLFTRCKHTKAYFQKLSPDIHIFGEVEPALPLMIQIAKSLRPDGFVPIHLKPE